MYHLGEENYSEIETIEKEGNVKQPPLIIDLGLLQRVSNCRVGNDAFGKLAKLSHLSTNIIYAARNNQQRDMTRDV